MTTRGALPTIGGEPLRVALRREADTPKAPTRELHDSIRSAVEHAQRERAHRDEVRTAGWLGLFVGLVLGSVVTAAILLVGGA